MIAIDLPAVPVPDMVASLIGGCMPVPVLQAEIDADTAAREIGRFRPRSGALLDNEDQADRERELSNLARANKTLAAYNPSLVLRAGGAS